MATIPRWRQWMGIAGINAIIDFINQNTTSVGTLSTSKVDGAASSTDNAIARFNGTGGKTIQNSTPIVQDDGRISTVTDPTSAQDVATKAYVDAASGVTAATYGDSTHVPQITVNARGVITSAASVAIAGAGSGNTTSAGTVAAIPAAGTAGNLYFPSDGVAVRRDSGSAWAPWGPLFPLTQPVDGDFSWVNQGTASVDTTYGGVFLRGPATTGENLRIRKKAAPTPPYTITACLLPHVIGLTVQATGILFRQSSDGKVAVFGLVGRTPASTVAPLSIASSKYNSASSFSADYAIRGWGAAACPIWMRIADDNTNRICSYSFDGQHWITFHSVGRTDFLTADEVGFYVNDTSNVYSVGVTLLSWKEN